MGVGDRLSDRGRPEDWVLAPEYALDMEYLLRPFFALCTGVVAGILAEGSLFPDVPGSIQPSSMISALAGSFSPVRSLLNISQGSAGAC